SDTNVMDRPAEAASAKPQGPLLALDGLKTYFDISGGLLARTTGRVHAVEGVSFELGHGETLALVGESGCGKSTTGRTILGLEKATAGSIKFNGAEVLGLGTEELKPFRRKVQMIFQDPYSSLNPRMTAGKSIAEPMIVHGIVGSKDEAKDRVLGLLKKVGLREEHHDRYPHEFSGGQRQRLCIARSLGTQPGMIIADEAVSALDVTIQAQVVNLMMDLQQDFGLSYLFISHDMAVVERISHRVAVMYLGRIVEIGPRRAVFENPQHPYTQRLLSAVPVADPKARKERTLVNTEIPSALRPLSYTPAENTFRDLGGGHYVSNLED
ncbi:MAG: oligopeptide/dipeptide ABC transporter ATP-binding protein, partial [Pseudomonadota bacterium]